MIKRFAAAIILWAGMGNAHAQTLSMNEVRDLFPGTYVVTVLGAYEVHVRMRSNGTLSGTSNGENDTGRWSVEQGKLCIQWDSWNGGRKDCSTLQRDGIRVQGRGFWFNAA